MRKPFKVEVLGVERWAVSRRYMIEWLVFTKGTLTPTAIRELLDKELDVRLKGPGVQGHLKILLKSGTIEQVGRGLYVHTGA